MLVYLSFTSLWFQKNFEQSCRGLVPLFIKVWKPFRGMCPSFQFSKTHVVLRGMAMSTNLTCIYSVNEKAFRSMKEQFSTFNCSRRLSRRIKKFKKILSSGFSEVSLVCTVGGAATHGGSLRTKQDHPSVVVAEEHSSTPCLSSANTLWFNNE